MLKSYLLVVCLLLVFFSCKKEENIVIKGEIENLEYPYILASYNSSDSLAIDTIEVKEKGKFNYVSTIDTLTVVTLHFNNNNSSAVIFADKGQKLSVKGDAQLPDLIRVTGNPINDELTSFKIENETLLKQRGQLLVNLQQAAAADSAVARNLAINDENVKINALNHELTQKAEDYIKENPEKMSSLVLINDFFTNGENPQALQRVLGYLKGDVTKTQIANRLKMFSEKINRSAEGELAPYFQATDKNGKTIHPNDFRGKYVLLSFISAAGRASRETVEVLKNTYKKVPKDSVQFVSIYVDSDSLSVEYPDTDSIPWTIVAEKESWGSDIVQSYNIQYIPFNVLISPEGRIKDRNIPAREIAQAIKRSNSENNLK